VQRCQWQYPRATRVKGNRSKRPGEQPAFPDKAARCQAAKHLQYLDDHDQREQIKPDNPVTAADTSANPRAHATAHALPHWATSPLSESSRIRCLIGKQGPLHRSGTGLIIASKAPSRVDTSTVQRHTGQCKFASFVILQNLDASIRLVSRSL